MVAEVTSAQQQTRAQGLPVPTAGGPIVDISAPASAKGPDGDSGDLLASQARALQEKGQFSAAVDKYLKVP